MSAIDYLQELKKSQTGKYAKKWLEEAIQALEQQPVLDKIREEIESCREDEVPHLCDYRKHRNEGLNMALDIIDKCKAESEDK